MKTKEEWLELIKKDLVKRETSSLEFIEQIQSDAIESTVRKCAEVVNLMGVGIDTIICHEKPNYKVYKYRGDPREAILSLIPQN